MLRKSLPVTLLLLITMVLMAAGAWAATTQNAATEIDIYKAQIQFIFDGEPLTPPEDQQGFIYNDSTYVPLRFISYALDLSVIWDGGNAKVTVQPPTDGERSLMEQYRTEWKDRVEWKADGGDAAAAADIVEVKAKARVYFKQIQYIFNDVQKVPDVNLPGMIIDNRLYVPMRFFSESSGININWDAATKTISANTPEYNELETEKSLEAGKQAEEEQLQGTPEQPPAPAPAPGGGSGGAGGIGGGGGSAPSKPASKSYDEIISDVEVDIASLKASCESRLWDIGFKYLAESDSSKRDALVAEGYAALGACDAQFDKLMTDLEQTLKVNGLSDKLSIISDYYDQYEDEKELAKQLVEAAGF